MQRIACVAETFLTLTFGVASYTLASLAGPHARFGVLTTRTTDVAILVCAGTLEGATDKIVEVFPDDVDEHNKGIHPRFTPESKSNKRR